MRIEDLFDDSLDKIISIVYTKCRGIYRKFQNKLKYD